MRGLEAMTLSETTLSTGYTNYYILEGGDLDALYTHPAYNWEWNDAVVTAEHASLCERDISTSFLRNSTLAKMFNLTTILSN